MVKMADSAIIFFLFNRIEMFYFLNCLSVYGDAHWYNDSGLERTVVNKLDPLAVLNTAMQRNKGTSKGSPRRISTSPARSSKFAGLSSTLITEECPPKALHFSP